MAQRLSLLLEELVKREMTELHKLPESTAGVRPNGENSWSPKEELGHLIDSAVNNHMRFMRASIEPEFHGPTYAQNDWVRAHGYQEMEWFTLMIFWVQYNIFLTGMVARIPEEKLQTLCFVGAGEPVALEFLIEDYVLHAQHHIDHLLGRKSVTAYPRQ